MDRTDFLNAIAASPYDRRLRLMFADWLEERGDVLAELWRGDVSRVLEFDGNSGVADDFEEPIVGESIRRVGDAFSEGNGFGFYGDGSGDGMYYGGSFFDILVSSFERDIESGDGASSCWKIENGPSGSPIYFDWQK